MTLEGPKSSDQVEYENEMRKNAWEQGNIDYLGKDSFDNILKKIQATMAQACKRKSQRGRLK
jgi:glycogenin glucosyltransferase